MMIVVIFTVVFWIFELGWVMYTYAVMADAANEGVRYAVVHSGGDVTGTKAKVTTFAQTSLHDVRGRRALRHRHPHAPSPRQR